MVETKPEGLRELRRRTTYVRIAETALRLFVERGYDATTLEMIAEAADISRRTFFAYFRSKDEILRAWERQRWSALLDDVRRASPDAAPLDAVRDVLLQRTNRYGNAELKALARLMHSSEALEATRHASFAEREALLYETLCEVWRQPERRLALRLVAMMAVGVLRVAAERWEQPGNVRSLQRLMRDAFDALSHALPETTA